MKYSIVVEGLTKVYGKIKALNGVSFSVLSGEVFGLLGPNGAGKTTTIKILTTLSRPNSGRAIIHGYDVVKHPKEVKRIIGVVPQHINLDIELTVLENLVFHGLLYKMKKNYIKKRAYELLKFVGLEDRAEDFVENLSGGMKRKLLIARALMHNPKVLFLDEPTVGLDPHTRRKIWDLILNLKKRGITILLTTHYIEEAELLCDRVGILDKGKIIALDTPENLKKKVGEYVLEIFNEKIERIFFKNRNEARRFIEDHCRKIECNYTLRKTNLEDVFIEMTGRKLSE